MSRHELNGGCHCGNVLVTMELADAPGAYSPRACDCDFCRKHGAAYVSDPRGSLRVRVKDQRHLGKYRQGSGIADFLICRNCGVLVGVAYEDDGRLYATVNSRVIDGGVRFGAEQSVSPKQLAGSEKTERWKSLWFADVDIA